MKRLRSFIDYVGGYKEVFFYAIAIAVTITLFIVAGKIEVQAAELPIAGICEKTTKNVEGTVNGLPNNDIGARAGICTKIVPNLNEYSEKAYEIETVSVAEPVVEEPVTEEPAAEPVPEQPVDPAPVPEPEPAPAPEPLPSDSYTDAELMLLANTVYEEARGESQEGQVAVVEVILNRVSSSHFPNTVTGVITEGNAFESYGKVRNYTEVKDWNIYQLCVDTINGKRGYFNDSHVLYFKVTDGTSNFWGAERCEIIGRHSFYRA